MLACASTAFAQNFPVTLKSTDVIPGMFMLEGEGDFAGGNMTLLVGDDRIFLIDDGIEAIGPNLIETAAALAGRPVDFVINTYVHGDHVGSNAALASKADLQAAVDMLADSQARVAALVDQGMSEEDIVAANPLALYHDDWNWGFITTERMTRTLIRSMAAEQAE